MGDYVDSHGIGRNFTPEQLGQEHAKREHARIAARCGYCQATDHPTKFCHLGTLGLTDEEYSAAWDQLQRTHDYLQQRVDLAYLDLYHNGESAGLYDAWQEAGDAMWIVRDALKGRYPILGTRHITSLENLVRREEESL